ncbi:hypothetical protein [Streptomyces sp. WAC06614]|uniref:hypothetical protein n=1 Tax=Streptomyces sp. WAC06614 TaxID=2487416 RepID=UPI000F7A70BF|nr:hypothetical protein [Streptomyces sp. WAC06614]RSS79386.1 hypothetical protein EF918_17580 [Streptomyces sp. WAC06614]
MYVCMDCTTRFDRDHDALHPAGDFFFCPTRCFHFVLCRPCFAARDDIGRCCGCDELLQDLHGDLAVHSASGPVAYAREEHPCSVCGDPGIASEYCATCDDGIVFCAEHYPEAGTDFSCNRCGAVWNTDTAGSDEGPAVVCIACELACEEPDTFRCPTAGCPTAMTACRACVDQAGGQVQCTCGGFLRSGQEEARRVLPPGHTLIGWDGPPSPGRPQTGMQCYAAATATACDWATGGSVQLTTDEAMHLYLSSDRAVGTVAEGYRAAFAEEGGRRPQATVTEVQAAMKRTENGILALVRAMNAMGAPEFPDTVARQYLADITGADLKQALAAGRPVMLARPMHWLVIYACEVDTAGEVAVVHWYDPSDGLCTSEPWDRVPGPREGYAVG